jgi:hypothetical protein
MVMPPEPSVTNGRLALLKLATRFNVACAAALLVNVTSLLPNVMGAGHVRFLSIDGFCWASLGPAYAGMPIQRRKTVN